ncbi:hypothetical protein MBLNU459_g5804t1 [Dothideomycetes sp. NU459]
MGKLDLKNKLNTLGDKAQDVAAKIETTAKSVTASIEEGKQKLRASLDEVHVQSRQRETDEKVESLTKRMIRLSLQGDFNLHGLNLHVVAQLDLPKPVGVGYEFGDPLYNVQFENVVVDVYKAFTHSLSEYASSTVAGGNAIFKKTSNALCSSADEAHSAVRCLMECVYNIIRGAAGEHIETHDYAWEVTESHELSPGCEVGELHNETSTVELPHSRDTSELAAHGESSGSHARNTDSVRRRVIRGGSGRVGVGEGRSEGARRQEMPGSISDSQEMVQLPPRQDGFPFYQGAKSSTSDSNYNNPTVENVDEGRGSANSRARAHELALQPAQSNGPSVRGQSATPSKQGPSAAAVTTTAMPRQASSAAPTPVAAPNSTPAPARASTSALAPAPARVPVRSSASTKTAYAAPPGMVAVDEGTYWLGAIGAACFAGYSGAKTAMVCVATKGVIVGGAAKATVAISALGPFAVVLIGAAWYAGRD